MKYITILFLLGLSVSVTASGAPPSARVAEGHWVNAYEGVSIAVDRVGHDLRVKGLRRSNRWTRYARINANRWVDRDGNALVLTSRHQLLLVPRGRGRTLQLTRADAVRNYRGSRCTDTRLTSRARTAPIQYFVRELDEVVELQYVSNGLRARRLGGAWVQYQQDSRDSSRYYDRQGNVYRQLSNGDFKWVSRDRSHSLNLFRR